MSVSGSFRGRVSQGVPVSGICVPLRYTHTPVETADTAEITHEALIECWDRMAAWMIDARNDVRFDRRLEEAAARWREERAKKEAGHPGDVLWRSSDLERGQAVRVQQKFAHSAVRGVSIGANRL